MGREGSIVVLCLPVHISLLSQAWAQVWNEKRLRKDAEDKLDAVLAKIESHQPGAAAVLLEGIGAVTPRKARLDDSSEGARGASTPSQPTTPASATTSSW